MSNSRASVAKLRKLKQIRRKNLEKNFLEIQMKGMDHYVFIKENGKENTENYIERNYITVGLTKRINLNGLF